MQSSRNTTVRQGMLLLSPSTVFQLSVGLTDSIGLRSRQPFSDIRPDDKLGNEVIVDLTKTSSEPKSMVSANMRNPETLRPLPRSIFGMTEPSECR
jgi:hypothetical protein